MKSDLRYTPTVCFQTFPFPKNIDTLNSIGEAYRETRLQIMVTRWEGLTAIYNRFHNPDESAADITQLRDLHVEMDRAVAAAYGWDDLDLAHGFHKTAQGVRFTISEAARREVLSRLLRLNHERYAEEVRQGLRDKGAKKGKKGGKSAKKQTSPQAQPDAGGDEDVPPEQMDLFDDGNISPQEYCANTSYGSADEIARCHKEFAAIDANGDGYITAEEVTDYYRLLLQTADVKKDGKITLDEWLAVAGGD